MDDGASAFKRGYDIGVAVGHNLEVWKYTPTDKNIGKKICDDVHNALAAALQFILISMILCGIMY